MFDESGRAPRFEMDHRTAKAQLINCDDFDRDNIVTACRSGNVMLRREDLHGDRAVEARRGPETPLPFPVRNAGRNCRVALTRMSGCGAT